MEECRMVTERKDPATLHACSASHVECRMVTERKDPATLHACSASHVECRMVTERKDPATLHAMRFPGESTEYRAARDRLLREEAALRRHIEEVAALRRGLPLGGPVAEDYVFEEGSADLDDVSNVRKVRLSDLFERGKNTLV